MTLREFLRVTEGDYDTYDTEYDAEVTCCWNDTINDNYDKFCDLIHQKVKVVRGGACNGLIVNWCELIRKNMDKFKAYTKENWRYQYDDEDEFIYQWICEIHLYLAGYVSDDSYAELVTLAENLEPVTD